MYGPQDREHNFVLNIFWAWWWPVEMLAYLFVGKCIKNERGAKSYFYLNRLPTLKHTQKHVYIQIMIRWAIDDLSSSCPVCFKYLSLCTLSSWFWMEIQLNPSNLVYRKNFTSWTEYVRHSSPQPFPFTICLLFYGLFFVLFCFRAWDKQGELGALFAPLWSMASSSSRSGASLAPHFESGPRSNNPLFFFFFFFGQLAVLLWD